MKPPTRASVSWTLLVGLLLTAPLAAAETLPGDSTQLAGCTASVSALVETTSLTVAGRIFDWSCHVYMYGAGVKATLFLGPAFCTTAWDSSGGAHAVCWYDGLFAL